MAPYGGEDDDCVSTSTFSVLSEDPEEEAEISRLKSEIAGRLKKHRKPLNILLLGRAGVGKSSFISSISAALSGHWHDYAYAGRYGGEGRPMSWVVQRFPDCCLSDEEYRRPYAGCRLPTMIDVAGLPDETNEVEEEILRMLMYGRLPDVTSIAGVEEYGKTHGIEGLRKKYPAEEKKFKVDRVVFLASANESVPEKLINLVIRAARPSGTKDNNRMRSIPVYGVLTKIDTVSECSFEDFQAKVKQFAGCLGLEGSEHRLMKCSNYCGKTAPERTERNSPELDKPILKFMKQLVDPFVSVTSDKEGEDFSHLNPPPPKPPVSQPSEKVQQAWLYCSTLLQTGFGPVLAIAFGLFCLVLSFSLSGPRIDMKSLHLTCARVRDMPGNMFQSSGHANFPELKSVCDSLVTVQHCVLGYAFGLLSLLFGLVLIARRRVQPVQVKKKED